MKAGAEIHFLSGQLYTLGIAFMTVLPRMPFDDSCSVGGDLSYPFRRALLLLIGVGSFRVLLCHLLPFGSTGGWKVSADAALGTIHVVGQSFLCLTTAYILQCQLSCFINIEGGRPGRSLLPYLVMIAFLTILGSVGSSQLHAPNLWCLVNLAEAISCIPVLKTLKTYVSVTSSVAGGNSGSRSKLKGPVLTQIICVCEYWYLATCLMSFVAEGLHQTEEDEDASGKPWLILLATVRHNQDNGIDDWTRLLIHSVFLNSIDEMQHVTRPAHNCDTVPTERDDTNSESAFDYQKGEDGDRVALVRRRKAALGDIL